MSESLPFAFPAPGCLITWMPKLNFFSNFQWDFAHLFFLPTLPYIVNMSIRTGKKVSFATSIPPPILT